LPQCYVEDPTPNSLSIQEPSGWIIYLLRGVYSIVYKLALFPPFLTHTLLDEPFNLCGSVPNFSLKAKARTFLYKCYKMALLILILTREFADAFAPLKGVRHTEPDEVYCERISEGEGQLYLLGKAG